MATIKDIAEAVGVSTASVSRVLNHDATLSLSMRKRQAILEAAEALRYTTPRGRRISAGRTASAYQSVIALVHHLNTDEELADPHYLTIRVGIEARLRELGLEPVRVLRNKSTEAIAGLDQVSGILAVGHHSESDLAWLRIRCDRIVAVDFKPLDPDVDCVTSNLSQATTELLATAEALGYRRIGFIGGRALRHPEGLEQRHAAYVDFMRERGRFDPAICSVGRIGIEDGYALTRSMLDVTSPPDLLVAANDSMAIGAYRAITERGLSIPHDIAVIGFNDIPAAEYLTPALTTVKLHAEGIGAAAVDLLLELQQGRDFAKHVTIAAKLVWRNSSRIPEAAARAE